MKSKKNIFVFVSVCCFLFSIHTLFSAPQKYTPKFVEQYQKKELFKPIACPLKYETIQTNPLLIQKAARDALLYFDNPNPKYEKMTHSAKIPSQLTDTKKSKKTLEFLVDVIEKDKKLPSFRILDTAFLKKHFNFIKWSGDREAAKKNNVYIPKWPDGGRLKPGKIKLTGYAVFAMNGSYKKTEKYNHALYSITGKTFKESDRLQYSRQNILNGALEQHRKLGQIKPLVWLTKHDLEEAMLQGTAFVTMPNNKTKIFNVHLSNRMTYDKALNNGKTQKKYWYFKDVTATQKQQLKFINYGGTIFAGNISDMGLGKIIALSYENPITRKDELRLGVLLDRGSAFADNLYQLDLFAGIFKSRHGFKEYMKHLPNTTKAYVLVKK
jgi:hypothetical protein